MDTFVTVLGHRPSALATAYRTLVTALGLQPASIQLWTTSGIQPSQVQSLQAWLAKDCAVPIATYPLGDIKDSQCVAQVVKLTRSLTGRVVFFADGGPNFLVAVAARNMPPDAIIVHCDDRQMLVRDYQNGQLNSEETFDLVNLGLPDLMSLYDLRYTPVKYRSPRAHFLHNFAKTTALPNTFYLNLRIEDCDPIDLAFERQGLLYAAFEIFEPEGKPGRKQTIRRVRALSELHVPKLRPQIAVVSNLYDIGSIAAEYGCLGVRVKSARSLTSKLFSGWAAGRFSAIKSGKATFQPQACVGKGGAGPPCIINMGEDASSTVVALFTHEPKVAYLCYDRETAKVKANVRQLAVNCMLLPVNQLRFIATNHFGSGLEQQLPALFSVDRHSDIHCNVSPGSKAQSTLISRLDQVKQLWSIDNPAGVVRCLLDEAERPKQPISVMDQARLVGGPLLSTNTPIRPSESVDDRTFFHRLTQFLWKLAEYRRERKVPVDWRVFGRIPETHNMQRRSSIRQHGLKLATDTDWITLRYEPGKVKVVGNLDNQPIRGSYATGTLPGHWFEFLVGQAFAAVCDEVVMGLIWDRRYPTARELLEQTQQRRAEVDVAARSNHNFYTAECKTSIKEAATDRQYVSAVTRTLFGRFAKAFVVYPVAPRSLDPQKGVAQVLDLSHLSQPEKLRQVLQDAVSRARQ